MGKRMQNVEIEWSCTNLVFSFFLELAESFNDFVAGNVKKNKKGGTEREEGDIFFYLTLLVFFFSL